MAVGQPTKQGRKVVYSLQGTLLEVCSCGVLCPCWVGEDPDGGECFSFMSHDFDRGEIDGIDVSGLTIVSVVHIPGNVLTPKSWKMAMFVSDKATEQQKDAMLRAFSGQLGGPLADLAGLVGEIVSVESAPIEHTVVDGKGELRIPGVLEAAMAPYRSAEGTVTTLRDSIFSTVPGSPAWVGKASHQKVDLPQFGLQWDRGDGFNAIQAEYKMEYVA